MDGNLSGLLRAASICALLATGCSEVERADAGSMTTDAGPRVDAGTVTTDAGEEDAGRVVDDAGSPIDAGPPGCMTGVFATSTFGSSCFGE